MEHHLWLGIISVFCSLGPAAGNTAYASGYGYPSGSAAPNCTMNMTGTNMSNMNMGNMNMGNMNFNLSTPQGILAFLNMEGINPKSLVTTNCVANGNPCVSGGQSCCLSPVLSCQGSPGTCKVVPGHAEHIPQIQQIVKTAGVSTQNPIS